MYVSIYLALGMTVYAGHVETVCASIVYAANLSMIGWMIVSNH